MIETLKILVEENPPYGAEIKFIKEGMQASGWDAPKNQLYLDDCINRTSLVRSNS